MCGIPLITKDDCEAHENQCLATTSSSSVQHAQCPQQHTNLSTAEAEVRELASEIAGLRSLLWDPSWTTGVLTTLDEKYRHLFNFPPTKHDVAAVVAKLEVEKKV